MPIKVAIRVPRGMDFRGRFKSPDSPTPAVIPVNAGNTIAKMRKNWPLFRNFVQGVNSVNSAVPLNIMGLIIRKKVLFVCL